MNTAMFVKERRDIHPFLFITKIDGETELESIIQMSYVAKTSIKFTNSDGYAQLRHLYIFVSELKLI